MISKRDFIKLGVDSKKQSQFDEPLDLLDLVASDAILKPPTPFSDFIYLGGKYHRCLSCIGYPKKVILGWLKNLYRLDVDFTISFHVFPTEKHQMIKSLGRRQIATGSNLELAQKHGSLLDPEDIEAHEDAERLRQQLARGDNKMFYVGFYIGVEAHNLDVLEEKTLKVEAELKSQGIVSKRSVMHGLEAYLSVVPMGTDYWKVHHTFTTEAMNSVNPLAVSELPGREGLLLGQDAINGSLVVIDPFRLQNANVLIMAMSGAGKTTFVKMFICRELALYNTRVVVIDPEDEYSGLIREFGGKKVDLSQPTVSINPLQIHVDYDAIEVDFFRKKLDWLQGLFRLMLGKLDAREKGLLEQNLIEAYREKGITDDPTSLIGSGHALDGEVISFGRRPKACPILADVYRLLAGKEETKYLSHGLWRWVSGALNHFNCQSSIDSNHDLLVFNIKGLGSEELRTVAAYIVAGYCWDRLAQKTPRRTRIVVDECHLLLKYKETAEMMERFARQCRKYNAGQIAISQNIDEFLANAAGRSVASNSALQVLLRQHETSLPKICEQFQLTSYESQYLATLGRGEALVAVIENSGKARIPLKVLLSPKELELYSPCRP